MREGNVFIGVYQSVHMGRGRDSVDLWTHVPRERGVISGPMFLLEEVLGVRYRGGGRVFGGRVSGG